MALEVKVLIIEDDSDTRNYFAEIIKLFFGKRVNCIFASSLIEAREAFEKHLSGGIDMIFIDACLQSTRPNSMPLVKHIISSYSGPLFAMSSSQHYISPLLKAGCNSYCLKNKLPECIDKYLRT